MLEELRPSGAGELPRPLSDEAMRAGREKRLSPRGCRGSLFGDAGVRPHGSEDARPRSPNGKKIVPRKCVSLRHDQLFRCGSFIGVRCRRRSSTQLFREICQGVRSGSRHRLLAGGHQVEDIISFAGSFVIDDEFVDLLIDVGVVELVLQQVGPLEPLLCRPV